MAFNDVNLIDRVQVVTCRFMIVNLLLLATIIPLCFLFFFATLTVSFSAWSSNWFAGIHSIIGILKENLHKSIQIFFQTPSERKLMIWGIKNWTSYHESAFFAIQKLLALNTNQKLPIIFQIHLILILYNHASITSQTFPRTSLKSCGKNKED